MRSDYKNAELSSLERAIVDYSVKLTQQPANIDSHDIANLRNNGLDDRGIHDLCSIVGYFAFANRVANGLGIDLESKSEEPANDKENQ